MRFLRPLRPALGVVLALTCVACGGSGGGESPAPTSTPSLDADFGGIAVSSTTLEVGPADVRMTSSGDAAVWRVDLECRAASGCDGQLRATIYFTGASGEEIARVSGAVAASAGETMAVQGVRRPLEPVRSVDRVEVDFTGVVLPQATPSAGFIRRPTPVRPTPYD